MKKAAKPTRSDSAAAHHHEVQEGQAYHALVKYLHPQLQGVGGGWEAEAQAQ